MPCPICYAKILVSDGQHMWTYGGSHWWGLCLEEALADNIIQTPENTIDESQIDLITNNMQQMLEVSAKVMEAVAITLSPGES